ncbi:MAG: PEGA domain-containing protein [Myxococcaceae bacterium]|nr:MAG: PEGA domain-containing protein [Myxococcaceae bacterium]
MTPHQTRTALALLVAASLTVAPSRGVAQTRDVDAMIRRGLELRRGGRDLEAFQTFEAAWEASHGARARAQMSLAAQALGRWADADRFLREALAVADDPWVAGRRAALERSLAEIDAHLGRLELRCNVDGALVRVDGTPRGTTPLAEPLRLPAGSVTLQVGAPGYLDVTRQAVLAVDQTTREEIDLVAVPRVAMPVAPPIGVPVTALVRRETPPHREPPPAEGDPAPARRVLAWTTGAVALTGVALGAVFLALRNTEADAFNARNEDADPANDCQRGSSASVCVDAESAVSTRGAVATTGFILGGAAAVASAVLFATLPPRASPTRAGLRGCAVAAGRGGAGVLCEVAF